MKNAENSQKQKILMPSLKENQRYIVYSVDVSESRENSATSKNSEINETNLDSQAHTNITNQCINLLGVFESAKAGVMTVKNNKNKGILRVNSRYLDKLKICLGLIKVLKSKGKDIPARVECIYVSGMLGKAEKML
jgi:RNase P/RNase MRP subunit POP5